MIEGCSWSLASERAEFPSMLWDVGVWALLMDLSSDQRAVLGCDEQGSGGIRAAPPAQTTGLTTDAQSDAIWPSKNPSHRGTGVSYPCTHFPPSLITEQHLQLSHQALGHCVIFGSPSPSHQTPQLSLSTGCFQRAPVLLFLLAGVVVLSVFPPAQARARLHG